MKGLPLRAPRGHASASHECATAPLYERNSTKRLGKMSALSALPPPPLDCYAKSDAFFAFAEAVAAGRRPGRAKGPGSAGSLQNLHYTTLLYWCAARLARLGVSEIIAYNPKRTATSLVSRLRSIPQLRNPYSYRGCAKILDAPARLSKGRISDHSGDLLDHWRLRPDRSVWPHLTDNRLGCTQSNPGYTPVGPQVAKTDWRGYIGV